jgi:hypothetical protein
MARLESLAHPMKAIFSVCFAALPLLMGCRQLVGIEDRQVFDGGTPVNTLIPACGLPTRGAACAACVTENCCTAATQCTDDPLLCSMNELCVQTCPVGDSACRLGCSKQWTSVNLIETQLQDCRDSSCVDACGPWDCLGNVSWQIPQPLPATITITATAMCGTCSSIGGTDYNAGVHVRVCSVADPECKAIPELVSGFTGPDGKVKLTFNTPKEPASVFLDFDKGGYLDDLLMLDTPPLSYDFDVGVVKMDTVAEVNQIATDIGATPPAIYDPTLALVKLRVGNCNLQRSTGVDLTWDDPGQAIVDLLFGSEWDAVAMNLPVPPNETTRVVARKAAAVSQDAGPEPVIASVNLVVRAGAVTLAPFITPTP